MQLTSDPMGAENPGFILRMVKSNINETLPSEQLEVLKALEDDIKTEVFDGLNFRIEQTDDNFVPLK